MKSLKSLCFVTLSFVVCVVTACAPVDRDPAPREGLSWLKGNTHAHTLWSDGNAPPEEVIQYYDDRDYDFLCLTEHNILADHERWFPVEEGGRLEPDVVDKLIKTYGEEWVEKRVSEGVIEMRLKRLDELQGQLKGRGSEMLLVPSEEVTDAYSGKPVHINGLNFAGVVEPQHGDGVKETIERNYAAIIEHGAANKRQVLAHVNHPNFGWGVRFQDLAAVEAASFFEVYNGHAGVQNYGDDTHSGTEALWDLALTSRILEHGFGLLLGVATDDSHDYREFGIGRHNPGRGWVMVQADENTPDAIVLAMRAGRFYATTGVLLRDVQLEGKTLRIWIEEVPGVRYTTRFVGTRKTKKGVMQPSEIFLSTESNPAVFTLGEDALYVRAKISSDREHPNPYLAGDRESAWVQPVRGPAAR
jgi:histidinol phosphatase-like PHP family hydrolase